ncbi:response regulator transcription factor [Tistrella mobilis]|uniref:response regulator n=1 Tax=Tistrella mobilis TaxID=171437 RepID=UPI000C0B5598|nr:response regulator transcription factor [uncultured Tistrella sp.]MAM76075.1 DNA-binding response regulator [Tistrella sp.]
MRVLLVEDDDRLSEGVVMGLTGAGFAVDRVEDGEGAEAALAVTSFDVVVLDLGLPDVDGLELVRRWRGRSIAVPVLILTARDGVQDRVAGLDGGADDYLPKPFAMPELVARVRALMRRPGGALGLAITCGDLTFDTVGRETRVGGRLVALGRRETALLEVLLRRQGRVVPKDSAEAAVYGFDDAASANTLEVLVHRLRKRLEGAGSAVRIHTLRGLGYLLDGGEGVDGGA